ncbi:MAG: hypothetical protein RMK29_00220 [Myxococcales bacterium]|nr:hypothetical protein [Myxococcota bacterium]MDW8280100.1 hypothetical protein [Myxococcales bacterium]
MRPVGFSTGALGRGDFRGALQLLSAHAVPALELSALRRPELPPLLGALAAGELDLSRYAHVSLHAPSCYPPAAEAAIAHAVLGAAPLPVVLHPDALVDAACWQPLGDRLLIENMDLRKRTGQSAAHLAGVFARLPAAGFCLDLGHALQVDATLSEAREMLRRFADRLRQVHLSLVDATGAHRPLHSPALLAFRTIAGLIPAQVPVILETPVAAEAVGEQLARALEALPEQGQ